MQRFCNILVSAFSYLASGGRAANFTKVLSLQSLVVIGSNTIPIPGAVGIADFLYLDGFNEMVPQAVHLELMTRTISFYASVLLCAAITAITFLNRKRVGRHN